MPDLGLTHVALSVRDLDASISFYKKYAGMASCTDAPTTACAPAGSSTARAPLSSYSSKGRASRTRLDHSGISASPAKSREEIDQLCAEARREGRPTRAPIDLGEPIGYVARIADPDGNSLELSFGQEVGLAVGRPAER